MDGEVWISKYMISRRQDGLGLCHVEAPGTGSIGIVLFQVRSHEVVEIFTFSAVRNSDIAQNSEASGANTLGTST